eukprot:12232751-Alexandrium_andersonii.AAC.1
MVKETAFKMVKEDEFVLHWRGQGLSQLDAERKWDAAEGDPTIPVDTDAAGDEGRGNSGRHS